MKSKFFLASLALTCVLSVGAMLPYTAKISEKEAAAMLAEADDFIDNLPDGIQDSEANAVLRANQGDFGSLRKLRASLEPSPSEAAGVNHTDFSYKGMDLRLYSPESETPLPLLVYIHGGGWALGSVNACSVLCDSLAATGKVSVLAFNYSLSPEVKYPKALEECVSVIELALQKQKEWNCSSVSVGGDSAGGNLALASAFYLLDKGEGKDIASLLLFYPVMKAFTERTPSWRKYSRGYGIDRRLMDAFFEAYLSEGLDTSGHLLSPGLAEDSLLRQLPPILIVRAERDIFFDQSTQFSDRLKKLGKKIDLVTFPGAVHSFATVEGQPTAFALGVKLFTDFLTHP